MVTPEELVGLLTLQHRTLSESLVLLDEVEAHPLWPVALEQHPELGAGIQQTRHSSMLSLTAVENTRRGLAADAKTNISEVQTFMEGLTRLLKRLDQDAGIHKPKPTDAPGAN